MRLKKLTTRNIQQIIDLEARSAPDKPYYAKYDLEALNFLFDNPDKCGAIGIFDDKQLIGWGAYRTNWKKHTKERGSCEVSSIVVDISQRRKGLGSKILDGVLEEIKKNNSVKNVFLTVSPLNISALSLYIRYGFIIYDFRKDVYGPGADRVYLNKILKEKTIKL